MHFACSRWEGDEEKEEDEEEDGLHRMPPRKSCVHSALTSETRKPRFTGVS